MDSKQILVKSLEAFKDNLEHIRNRPVSLLKKNIENIKRTLSIEIRKLEDKRSGKTV
jgi:hypothetical protein